MIEKTLNKDRESVMNRLVCSDPEFATLCGATHLKVEGIRGMPQWYDPLLMDNDIDPYPNWSQATIGLLRAFPPPVLAEWIPSEVTDHLRAGLDEKVKVMRQHGLRGMLQGLEPLWLPEAAYLAHPRWRGSQCELGRIAGKPYFAPNIDEPEVLDLYRHAMHAFCNAYPEFDIFSFFTNDSGTGLPWTTYAYPGPNGPMRSRHLDPGKRVVDWLDALQSGAQDADADVVINLKSFSFAPGEAAAIRARLGKHYFLNNQNGDGDLLIGAGTGCSELAKPVVGLFDPESFVQGLQQVFRTKDGTVRMISARDDKGILSRSLLEAFSSDPGEGSVHCARLLHKTAEKMVGADYAETLISVWRMVTTAAGTVRQVRQRGGVSLSTALTTARWLNRPLVLDPLGLTDQETADFRPYLFSTGTPEQDANLCYILGKPVFIGSGVVWMTRWCLQDAIDTLLGARKALRPLLDNLSGEMHDEMALYDARIGTFICTLETSKNVVQYQHALDISDQPRFGANPLDFDDNIQYDQRALELRKIARSEVDNCVELIELLDEFPTDLLIDSADRPEEETVFIFSPELKENLQHKIQTMLTHWHEYEQRFPTSKVYEFEPRMAKDNDELTDKIKDQP